MVKKMKRVGERIAAALFQEGMTPPGLAAQLGIKPPSIYDQIAKDNRFYARLDEIAKILKVDVEWLKTGQKPPEWLGQEKLSGQEMKALESTLEEMIKKVNLLNDTVLRYGQRIDDLERETRVSRRESDRGDASRFEPPDAQGAHQPRPPKH